MAKTGQTGTVLSPEHPFIQRIADEIRHVYGPRLRSIALFGSVARRSARPNSDVDLFVVVEDLPRGRFARSATFEPVEQALAGEMEALKRDGIETELSVVLRTPVDIQTASPLMLDMTEDAILLEDVGALLEEHRGRLPASVASEAERLADIAHRLRKEREAPFYGDEDFIPTEEYKREDTERALDEARFVLSCASAFPTEDR